MLGHASDGGELCVEEVGLSGWKGSDASPQQRLQTHKELKSMPRAGDNIYISSSDLVTRGSRELRFHNIRVVVGLGVQEDAAPNPGWGYRYLPAPNSSLLGSATEEQLLSSWTLLLQWATRLKDSPNRTFGILICAPTGDPR